ncbi:MAG TPA: VOC family protein [Anaerolineae bacterium]|nr:VOC family protein [Anaerolineae bacterium]
MITGICHYATTVTDLQRSMRFFGEVLGIEHLHTQVSDQPYLSGITGIPGCSLRIGLARTEGNDVTYEVLEFVHPQAGQSGAALGCVGTVHCCWEVDDLSAAHARLRERGVRFLTTPYVATAGAAGDRLGCFALDPDGHPLELIGSHQGHGGSGRLTRLHHVTLTVSDLSAALPLFKDTLGLRVTSTFEGDSRYLHSVGGRSDGRMRGATLNLPGVSMLLQVWEFCTPLGPAAKPAIDNVGSGHLCFRVDDIRRGFDTLVSHRIPIIGRPTEVTAGKNRGACAFHFAGPDGIRLELFQGPPT